MQIHAADGKGWSIAAGLNHDDTPSIAEEPESNSIAGFSLTFESDEIAGEQFGDIQSESSNELFGSLACRFPSQFEVYRRFREFNDSMVMLSVVVADYPTPSLHVAWEFLDRLDHVRVIE